MSLLFPAPATEMVPAKLTRQRGTVRQSWNQEFRLQNFTNCAHFFDTSE